MRKSRASGVSESAYSQSQLTATSDDRRRVSVHPQSDRAPDNGYRQFLRQPHRLVEMAPPGAPIRPPTHDYEDDDDCYSDTDTVLPADSISQVSGKKPSRKGQSSTSGSWDLQDLVVVRRPDSRRYPHSGAPSSHDSDLTVRQLSSEYGGSRDGGSRHGGSRDGESRHGESRHGESRHGGSRHGGSRHGGSRHGESRHGGSRDSGSRDGGSRHGGSRDGGSRDGGSRDGESRHGGSRDSGSRDGGSRHGGSRDGGSRDSGSRDGESRDGESRHGGSRHGGSRDSGSRDSGSSHGGSRHGESLDRYGRSHRPSPILQPVLEAGEEFYSSETRTLKYGWRSQSTSRPVSTRSSSHRISSHYTASKDV
ncbi:hypothetical protein BHYA_0206g00150 [Botrytis hyacinthi]|uniref:Uncharacterized protein n=1 Tax=Botrytis hyacinthi TaxID=278943 RepID=A0A4Z1GBC1_9HELO|nr:hypothetical protein BHYA_0206g00150 [Botrytis hyacinthi]